MPARRKVEIFSAGCVCCEDTISKIQDIACPDCEIIVLNMNEAEVTQRAQDLGVKSVPAVAIDGKLASCCAGRGPDEAVLRRRDWGSLQKRWPPHYKSTPPPCPWQSRPYWGMGVKLGCLQTTQ